jgi:hypothetical protein
MIREYRSGPSAFAEDQYPSGPPNRNRNLSPLQVYSQNLVKYLRVWVQTGYSAISQRHSRRRRLSVGPAPMSLPASLPIQTSPLHTAVMSGARLCLLYYAISLAAPEPIESTMLLRTNACSLRSPSQLLSQASIPSVSESDTILHNVDPPRFVNHRRHRPMVFSASRNRGHRSTLPGDHRPGCPRQYVWPSALLVTAQIDQVCLPCRLQRSSLYGLVLFPGNARSPSRKTMDHGLHLAKRHLGNVDSDVWIRPEQLEGGWDGVQVYGVGGRDRHGRGGMARGTGREVGIPCCRDGHGCGDWVSTGLIVRNSSVTAVCRIKNAPLWEKRARSWGKRAGSCYADERLLDIASNLIAWTSTPRSWHPESHSQQACLRERDVTTICLDHICRLSDTSVQQQHRNRFP